jgi:catechol-2,3-dioxygenase
MAAEHKFTFSHIGLYVEDLAKMKDFYTRVLGLAVTDEGELAVGDKNIPIVFLSGDPNEHHQIALAPGRPAGASSASIINQISLRADNLGKLKAVVAHLRDEGLPHADTVTHGNALSVYTRDPEGNRLELFIDLPWHVTQPRRDAFDLSGSDEEIMARAEKHARAQPGFAPREAWRAEMARRMGLA